MKVKRRKKQLLKMVGRVIVLMFCMILFHFNCDFSKWHQQRKKRTGGYVADVLNGGEMLHESGEGLKLESEEVVIEEATEEDVVATQSYTEEITGLT